MQVNADTQTGADNFLEPDLSYRVMGCFYNVRNKYGRFHREKVYDIALNEEFKLSGLSFVDKPKIPLYSVNTGKQISVFIPDKLVANKIIVEIKARPVITQEEYIRALEYLRVSEYEILYIVNFGEESFEPKRFIYSNSRKPFISLLKLKE
jgi:GxxExxY protein